MVGAMFRGIQPRAGLPYTPHEANINMIDQKLLTELEYHALQNLLANFVTGYNVLRSLVDACA